MIQWPEFGHDAFGDVVRGEAHDGRHHRAEGFFAADGQHRHGELALLGKEGLVVERILIEGGELREAGMHGAGQGIEFGVMLARGLGEGRGRGGKLVPEAVEIDALAPGDQPLHVRSAKAEVPQQRVLQDFLPRADAGQRRVDEDEARHTLRMLDGKGVADHVADIVGDEIGAVDLQRVEHAGDIAGLGLLVVAALGLGRQAEAAQIGHDHGVVAGKVVGHRRPHVAGFAVTVQQDDGRSRAADADVDRRAVGLDVLRLE